MVFHQRVEREGLGEEGVGVVVVVRVWEVIEVISGYFDEVVRRVYVYNDEVGKTSNNNGDWRCNKGIFKDEIWPRRRLQSTYERFQSRAGVCLSFPKLTKAT